MGTSNGELPSRCVRLHADLPSGPTGPSDLVNCALDVGVPAGREGSKQALQGAYRDDTGSWTACLQAPVLTTDCRAVSMHTPGILTRSSTGGCTGGCGSSGHSLAHVPGLNLHLGSVVAVLAAVPQGLESETVGAHILTTGAAGQDGVLRNQGVEKRGLGGARCRSACQWAAKTAQLTSLLTSE